MNGLTVKMTLPPKKLAPAPPESLLVDYPGAARLLGMTVPVLRGLVSEGKLRPCQQEGRRKHYFKMAELHDFVRNL